MAHRANEQLRLSGRVRIDVPEGMPSPVRHALRMLARDFEAVLGAEPEIVEGTARDAGQEIGGEQSKAAELAIIGGKSKASELAIRWAEESDGIPRRPEAYGFRFRSSEDECGADVNIIGHDELGLVYGMLEFSRRFLGIQPFWFWADQEIVRRDEIVIDGEDFDSPEPKVRYRGWFVNDEVCLIGWKDPYPPSREVWEPVFEALLRCGGNMVIPGTDLPRDGIHYKLAAEMGLWVMHHHAEPLGAEMFLRAYPGKSPSYQREPELFEKLWREAIEEQKDKKVVWVLSFRGQGDKPFWIDDPSFDTPEKRGAMISRVIRKQYDMIAREVENPVFCAALYGEISELYKGGCVDLPDDVIKVWADNGYGKMVSRRHGNQNYRVPALPAKDDGGKHGVYYHVTFHDLQASNHLTTFPGSAEFIKEEVEAAFASGADEYVLVNSGNIRPHVYTLDLIRELWNEGEADAGEHLRRFVRSYYRDGHEELEELYRTYSEAAIPYGPNADDRAGDEYYHHPARQIIGHWLTGQGAEPDPRLFWAVGDAAFGEQVKGFERLLEPGMKSWESWLERCDEALAKLGPDDRRRALDQLRFHGALHLSGCEGFYWLCRSYGEYAEKRYPQAFVLASKSMRSYRRGLEILRDSERGKWDRFYQADWLTNIRSTVENVDTLRRWLRLHGDSPDFFLWYKEFLMPVTEKYIYLENTHRNPLSDDELALRLEEFFGL
ncbi:glycosyl hydrolase 115 family protein [Cohnella thailandensis]|uniref:Glycosyl hydrolase 115 family protein n=1 Tax=Cohnella thailandensis TaxID=557557 RepID=A0A841SRL7_9BACL|nr:glycosyl hydrolase 115 family protein [Cohnella thailandensis]MBB6635033.1 glycosyl hydrolase 115 family protein [Cohnella thailandensis]MBP1975743.1 hypothetical protein [Cohnella thailandensis]